MCEAQNEIELILSATSNPLLISCLEKREAELREKRVQENSKALLQACKANEKFETITRIVNDGVSCIDITEDIKTQLEAAWGNDAVRIITVTPLYYAIIRGDQTIVDYLLEQGASISACKEIESHTYDTGSIHDWPKTETREAQLDLEKLAAKYGVSLPKKNK
jgi:ankyrin repeat protein